MTQLQKNIELAKLQKKVDELQVLGDAAVRLHAQNKDMVLYDLKRAKAKLAEAQA